ncbi:hypothetical protein D3C75_1064260 [compost metagenome]
MPIDTPRKLNALKSTEKYHNSKINVEYVNRKALDFLKSLSTSIASIATSFVMTQ